MRVTACIAGLSVWLGSAGLLPAQELGTGTVRVPNAVVRAGPSDVYPVTGYLRLGQAVLVTDVKGDFLAITPPAGSSSWILDRALSHTQTPLRGQVTISRVQLDDVVPRVGTPDSPLPSNVETVRLKRGTLIFLTGDQAMHENALWYRILPPPADVRYVARADVTRPEAGTTTAAKPDPVPAGSGRQMPPLWCQAEQAERAGDIARADLLYRQLAAQMSQPNGDAQLATLSWNRAEAIRQRTHTATWPARQPAPGMLVAGRTSAVPPAAAAPIGRVTSGPGWLRRSAVTIDGRATYVLEDNSGRLRNYVLAQPGLNMELYVNRPVEVFGPWVARADVAAGGYISVDRLHQLR